MRSRLLRLPFSRSAARVLATLIFLLGVPLVALPSVPYDTEHDSASHAAFALFFQQQTRFGVDLFENAGPLAFAHLAYTYSGISTAEAMAIANSLRLALAFLAAGLLLAMSGWSRRAVWLSVFLLPSLLVDADGARALDPHDVYALLTIYLSGIVLLRPSGSTVQRVLADASLAVLLAALSLMKHTFLVASLAAGALAIAARWFRGDVPGASRLTLLGPLLLAFVWVLAGQRAADLLDFLYGAVAFSSGYSEALASEGPPGATWMAGIALTSLLLLVGWRAARGDCSGWLALLTLALAAVLWKYGTTRSDEAHLAVLFVGVVHFVPAAAWASDVPARSRRPVALAIALGLLVLPLWGVAVCVPGPRVDPRFLLASWRSLGDWLLEPRYSLAVLRSRLEETKWQSALPVIQSRVRSSKIDQYGFRQGWLLLNELPYRPRPTPITFAASNRFLMERNERFYRGREAPHFVLASIESLWSADDQLLSQRDGLALGALFENYHPVARERGLALLQRNETPSRTAAATWMPLCEAVVRRGERVDVGDLGGSPFVWMTLELPRRWTARLRSVLFRPPQVHVRLWLSDGRVVLRRVNVASSDVPFLVSPLLESTEDLLGAWQGPMSSVTGLAVEPSGGMDHYFAETARVVLLQGPQPSRWERAPVAKASPGCPVSDPNEPADAEGRPGE
jgi:hypothetical protein